MDGVTPDLFSPAVEAPPPAPAKAPTPVPFATALLGLGTVKGLGLKGLRHLARQFGDDLGRVFGCDQSSLRDALAAGSVPGSEKLAEVIASDGERLLREGGRLAQLLRERGVTVIPPSGLPERLHDVRRDPPQWLFVEGDAQALFGRPVVALVGTRTPTERGVRAAATVARILSAYPVTVVSGLAEGIDDMAHRESLALGLRNVAFLGHGIDSVFPMSTGDVRQQIARSRGAVATEYLPWEHFQKRFFVERNRLQAGLADLVIPVEAHPEGGTAHTVRFARDYGRQLVGIRWPGANGIVEEFDREGVPVFDVTTREGCRRLDGVFRDLVERSGRDAYPLANIERQVLREIRARAVRPADVQRMIRTLENAAQEFTDARPPEGGDL